ncbi:MAG TPA: hypothetical protein VHX52_01480 [Steroidobacteraceae bacterium]|nr:hypothetical protein [Steroidobacteraceae bacterium]
MTMFNRVSRFGSRMALSLLIFTTGLAVAQPPARGGLGPKQIDELSHKHDGFYGALAPKNLAKPRPKAPFDMTGTWFVDLRKSFLDFEFGPPYPQFYTAGQAAMQAAAAAAKAHKPYRDSIGECYPAGMPMIMTRVWPINIIQLPTVVEMVFGFTNSLRLIYLDGRAHTDPDIAISTYNGESIGHWEGDTLVVDTKYFEPNQHWIDNGLPISDQFHIVERMRLLDAGKTLQIEYIMTDPDMWKGEWRSTKRWMREDYSDVPEVECLPNLNQNLPGTSEGDKASEQRASQAATAPAPATGTRPH